MKLVAACLAVLWACPAFAQQPMTQQQIFDARIRCSQFLTTLNAQLEQDQYDLESIVKVFYSQSLNTCLVAKQSIYGAHGTVPEGELLTIDNVLTGENVWTSQVFSPALKYWEAAAQLEQAAANYP